MIADLRAMREIIDQMTPDLRNDMPKTATEYGNRLFAMFLGGIASFLENDEVPWQGLADDEMARKLLAVGLRQDGVRIYHGMPDE